MTVFGIDLNSPMVWLALGLVLVFLELLLPGVYLLWIGLAALLVALPASLISTPAPYLLLLFFAVFMGISVWIGLRSQARKSAAASKLNQGLHAYLGQTVTVLSGNTSSYQPIRVQLAGTSYNAYCDQLVKAGDKVQITQVEDGRISVSKIAPRSEPSG